MVDQVLHTLFRIHTDEATHTVHPEQASDLHPKVNCCLRWHRHLQYQPLDRSNHWMISHQHE
jgi:hypothetical protein